MTEPQMAQTSPDYFITLREPGGSSRPAAFKGTNGADTGLRWHMHQSIRGVVGTSIRYRSNYPADEVLPDVLEHNDMLVVSQGLREAIEPWLKDYEFLPVEVERSLTDAYDSIGGGVVVSGYWWLNSWHLVDVIDWDRSKLVEAIKPQDPTDKYSRSPLKVNHWEQLRVRPASLDGEHFFGVKYVRGARRYLSPDLHRHLLRQRLKIGFGAIWLGPPNRDPEDVTKQLNTSEG